VNSKVYIIHGSAIVQNGLAEILRKYFKCSVTGYSTVNDLQESNVSITENTILLIDGGIAISKVQLQFLTDIPRTRLFRISIDDSKISHLKDEDVISINSSQEEIYLRVKEAFEPLESMDRESEGLSNREIEVLKLVALGYSNKEIAEKLFISAHTVISHRKNMTEKLGIKSISGLTVYAIINNYIDTTNIDINNLI
jgi:DNA-binding CsgD family transcriptional regulator